MDSTTTSGLRRFERTFLSFEGRIGRLRYLAHTILLPTGGLIVSVLFTVVLNLIPWGGWVGVALEVIVRMIGGTLFFAFFVLVIWIWLSAGIRRLHDMGASGWWMLLNLVLLPSFLLWLAQMLWPGQYGDNKYGPQPGYYDLAEGPQA